MLLQVIQEFNTLAGPYFMLSEILSDKPTDRNLAGKMYLAPAAFIRENDEHEIANKDKFKVDERLLLLFSLPETAHPQGHRQNRLLKFILTVFYEMNSKEFIPWQEARKEERIMAAELAYQRISGRSAYTELRRNHFQLVTKHDDLVIRDNEYKSGPYCYTQIRTYYEKEGVVICRWNLGEDGKDEFVVYDGDDGGKKIVNPLMTLSITEHYVKRRTETLRQIANRAPSSSDDSGPQEMMIRYFYRCRRWQWQNELKRK